MRGSPVFSAVNAAPMDTKISPASNGPGASKSESIWAAEFDGGRCSGSPL
jgi:hypothetical protein